MRGGLRENAGRPVGSKNKFDLIALFNAADFDFAEQIISLLNTDGITIKERIELVKALLPYVYGRRDALTNSSWGGSWND